MKPTLITISVLLTLYILLNLVSAFGWWGVGIFAVAVMLVEAVRWMKNDLINRL